MSATRPFELWLEFEHTEPTPADDPSDDFANILILMPDGRKYALNVWTFEFMSRARFPWPYEKDSGEPVEYLLPPDLFVAKLDRPTLERIVDSLLVRNEMKTEWLCEPNAENS